MNDGMTRRDWMCWTPAAFGVAGWLGWGPAAAADERAVSAFGTIDGDRREVPDNYPRQPLDEVEAVVRFAHVNLSHVKELVGRRPELAKASWDWGFGDWETPLGAASHTGQREIAEYLLEHGARPTIFTFAMLGDLDAVRAMINARPGVQQIPGPHGITLLAHAEAGGAQARAVVEYLKERGDAEPAPHSLEVPHEELTMAVGTYAFGPGEKDRLQVEERRGRLEIRRGNIAGRALVRVGRYEYHPTGAPSVRVQFDSSTLPTRGVALIDKQMTVKATRVPK